MRGGFDSRVYDAKFRITQSLCLYFQSNLKKDAICIDCGYAQTPLSTSERKGVGDAEIQNRTK